MTRQQAYQIRCRTSGRCIKCGKVAVPSKRKDRASSSFCERHLVVNRERMAATRKIAQAIALKSNGA